MRLLSILCQSLQVLADTEYIHKSKISDPNLYMHLVAKTKAELVFLCGTIIWEREHLLESGRADFKSCPGVARLSHFSDGLLTPSPQKYLSIRLRENSYNVSWQVEGTQ